MSTIKDWDNLEGRITSSKWLIVKGFVGKVADAYNELKKIAEEEFGIPMKEIVKLPPDTELGPKTEESFRKLDRLTSNFNPSFFPNKD